MPFLAYSDAIETKEKNEDDTINAIVQSMTTQSETVKNRERHAVRASHAKSTACLTGTLEVLPDIPSELAQGLFAEPSKHDVAVRFAQGPGETLHDKVSTHRGMAVKVFNVPGEKIPEHNSPQANTQDFVFASGPTFPSGTASGFARDGKMLQYATPMPEVVKSAVATVARNASSLAQAAGTESPLADFFGHPFTHPLSEPYYSQAPLRYGGYVAKLGFFPTSPQLDALQKIKIDTSNDPNAFRTAMIEYFRTEGITFELRAQIWTNDKTMPIEDTSIPWPEEESPYRTVAVLTIPRQEAHSEARSRYFDDVMSFRPAHSLVAHRPLGSVMRARLAVYDALSKYRHKENSAPLDEPTGVDQIPK